MLFDNLIVQVFRYCLFGLSYETAAMRSLLVQFGQEFRLTVFSVGGLIKTLQENLLKLPFCKL